MLPRRVPALLLIAATVIARPTTASEAEPSGVSAHAAPETQEVALSLPRSPAQDCVSAHTCLSVGDDVRLPSRSRGYPWRGRLERGVRLRQSPHLRTMPVDRVRGNFFGTERLVGLLGRVADRVAERAPGARLNVGELSRRGGGNIAGHRSHENGRDVDLGFYMVDPAGNPVETRRFVDVRRTGSARCGPERPCEFDATRNWMLVEALVTDPEVVVQHAFAHRSIRRLLVREGRRLGASEALIERVERVVIEPGVRHPHKNHFHLRIYCGPGDVPGCRDRGPYWPWLAESHPFHARIVPLPGLDVDAQRALRR